jgi:hypothetical protein
MQHYNKSQKSKEKYLCLSTASVPSSYILVLDFDDWISNFLLNLPAEAPHMWLNGRHVRIEVEKIRCGVQAIGSNLFSSGVAIKIFFPVIEAWSGVPRRRAIGVGIVGVSGSMDMMGLQPSEHK